MYRGFLTNYTAIIIQENTQNNKKLEIDLYSILGPNVTLSNVSIRSALKIFNTLKKKIHYNKNEFQNLPETLEGIAHDVTELGLKDVQDCCITSFPDAVSLDFYEDTFIFYDDEWDDLEFDLVYVIGWLKQLSNKD